MCERCSACSAAQTDCAFRWTGASIRHGSTTAFFRTSPCRPALFGWDRVAQPARTCSVPCARTHARINGTARKMCAVLRASWPLSRRPRCVWPIDLQRWERRSANLRSPFMPATYVNSKTPKQKKSETRSRSECGTACRSKGESRGKCRVRAQATMPCSSAEWQAKQ